jgi:cation diffusion facilitator family transporter
MHSEIPDQRSTASKRATFVSMLVNTLLAIGQIALGLVGNSQALVADGFHTLSDLSTDALVLYAVMHGAKEADEDHPYGHGRIETAATVFLGLLLAIVGLGIAINAALRLGDPSSIQPPEVITLLMAAITIVSKEGLYRYTIHVANRFHSNILRANAWHHRSDAISSVVVLIGIGGSILGLTYFDALAAIGLGMMIIRMGMTLSWNALKELIDTSLEAEDVAAIRKCITDIDGVVDLHMLRTRMMGGRALVDVHLQVNSDISVSEGHQISEAVRQRVVGEFDTVHDVLVHIDPEDDEQFAADPDLPLRSTVKEQVYHAVQAIHGAEEPERITLHYLRGVINIELVLPMAEDIADTDRQALSAQIASTLQQQPHIGQVEVYFHCMHNNGTGV